MIRIEQIGIRASVQDRGRFGHLRLGVPSSGPADPHAFAAAQALVGNPPDAAAIELIGGPFIFTCQDRRIIAVTGRDVALRIRGIISGWTAAFVRAGETVEVVPGDRSRFGYIAISGGVASEPVLGSRATYPAAGLGTPLAPGDEIPLGRSRVDIQRAGISVAAPDYDTGQIRAITGPHADRFSGEARSLFFSTHFEVDPASDRMGTRLRGPRIAARAGEILTCGVVAGAVQIPSGGSPIVLLADHQTTGGYPIVATVITADLGAVAQRVPGERLRFTAVERDAAVAALRGARDLVESIA